MGYDEINWARSIRRVIPALKGPRHHVLLQMSTYAFKDQLCTVTQRQLANGTGLSIAWVNHAVQELIQLGVIQRVAHGIYRLNINVVEHPTESFSVPTFNTVESPMFNTVENQCSTQLNKNETHLYSDLLRSKTDRSRKASAKNFANGATAPSDPDGSTLSQAKSFKPRKRAGPVKRRRPPNPSRVAGCPLPGNFVLTAERKAVAAQCGLAAPDRLMANFRSWYIDEHPDARSANWEATWKRWCITEIARRRPTLRYTPPPNRPMTGEEQDRQRKVDAEYDERERQQKEKANATRPS